MTTATLCPGTEKTNQKTNKPKKAIEQNLGLSTIANKMCLLPKDCDHLLKMKYVNELQRRPITRNNILEWIKCFKIGLNMKSNPTDLKSHQNVIYERFLKIKDPIVIQKIRAHIKISIIKDNIV